MKKSVLAILCAATLIACKKNETTVVDTTSDSTDLLAPADTSMMITDSATVSGMNNGSGMNDQDKKFADEAAIGGMMEVMSGQLAATKGTHADVKAHGEMMVKDHTKANDELKSWASSVGYTLPTSLDAAKQRKYDDLKTKTGADFDRAYTELMVSDHKEAIQKFKKQASDGTETSLKSFAGKTLPALEHHLTKTEEVRNAVK